MLFFVYIACCNEYKNLGPVINKEYEGSHLNLTKMLDVLKPKFKWNRTKFNQWINAADSI